MQIVEDPNEIGKKEPKRNSPWIAELEVLDSDPTYFIYVEQEVLCSTSSFSKAVYYWFAAFYIFNLEYEENTNAVPTFVQEYVFGIPFVGKKTSTYLSVSTDIQRETGV